MDITVVKQWMKHHYMGSMMEMLYLRQKAGTSKIHTQDDLAKEIQETSSLSKGDVTHTMGIFMTELRKVLVRGDRVKIDGLGTFYMTLSCKGVATENECSVRNITGVNIRFLPDKALKLVNGALASTRSDNNVTFAIESQKVSSSEDNSGSGSGAIDPEA